MEQNIERTTENIRLFTTLNNDVSFDPKQAQILNINPLSLRHAHVSLHHSDPWPLPLPHNFITKNFNMWFLRHLENLSPLKFFRTRSRGLEVEYVFCRRQYIWYRVSWCLVSRAGAAAPLGRHHLYLLCGHGVSCTSRELTLSQNTSPHHQHHDQQIYQDTIHHHSQKEYLENDSQDQTEYSQTLPWDQRGELCSENIFQWRNWGWGGAEQI